MLLPLNPAPVTLFSSPPGLGEKAVVVGVPLEYSGVGRPGSRLAPLALREASIHVTPYSRRAGAYLDTSLIGDAGDLHVDEPGLTLERLSRLYAHLFGKRIVVLLGGEHSITYAVAHALRDTRNPLLVIIDAHLDAAGEYRGYRVASPTVTLRAAELLGGDRIIHIGARAFHPREAERLEKLGVTLLHVDEYRKAARLASTAKTLHISIDVDILDPCHEPGAVTPEPEGITPTRLYDVVYELATAGSDNISVDIVEYTPLYDPSRIGAVNAVKSIVELLAARLAS